MNRSLKERQKMKAKMATIGEARGVIRIKYRIKRCEEVDKETKILLIKK